MLDSLVQYALAYCAIGFLVSFGVLLIAYAQIRLLHSDMPLGGVRAFLRVIAIYSCLALIWPFVVISLAKGLAKGS